MAMTADHAVLYVRVPLALRQRIQDDLEKTPYTDGAWRKRTVQTEVLKLLEAHWPAPAGKPSKVVSGPQLELPGTTKPKRRAKTPARKRASKKGGRK